MELMIDTASPLPVYEQIVNQIERAVTTRQLAPGSPLPRIRQLARDLEINPNTVAKAYQILEQRHIVVTAGRRGTFVHQAGRNNVHEHAEQLGEVRMVELLSELQRGGLPVKAIRNIFRAAIERLESPSGI